MAAGDLYLYAFTFTIDGKLHLGAGHAATAMLALNAAKLTIQRRNIDIPLETTELVNVRFDITQDVVDKMAAEVRSQNPETALPEGMSPQDKAYLMHKPESEVVGG